jgi:hypothetical protein
MHKEGYQANCLVYFTLTIDDMYKSSRVFG